MQRAVIHLQALLDLCHFRNVHPAFNGTFTLLDTHDDIREVGIPVPEFRNEGNGTATASSDPVDSRAFQGAGWAFSLDVAREASSAARSKEWCASAAVHKEAAQCDDFLWRTLRHGNKS
jgi:hypothetical protein